MSDLQLFNNPEFGSVRVVEIDGEAWFVAADVCRVLEIQNTTQALERLDDDERSIFNIGRQGNANIINESGLYALVSTSRKPEAKKFRKWVTNEVLPTIRKTGMYINPRGEITGDMVIALGLRMKELETKNALLTTQVAELQPKASYYDLILNCTDLVSTSIIAKDYGFSAKVFNRLLHRLGVQFKQSETWLLYQKYASQGWTSTKTHIYIDKNGREHCRIHTYWTQKGRIELYNLLKRKGYLPTIERSY